MHSFGETRMQPSTACSASGECGGRRSTEGVAEPLEVRRRRLFFKSGLVVDSSIIQDKSGPGFRKRFLQSVRETCIGDGVGSCGGDCCHIVMSDGTEMPPQRR